MVSVQKRFFATMIVLCFWICAGLEAQTKPIVILGGTLIDGTGRAPVPDTAIVMQGGRFLEVGKRGRVRIPSGAERIDAKGKTIIPGLIDGHCHYAEWASELYLGLGVTTCPDINGNPAEVMAAKREAIERGTMRGPRLWFAGLILDGQLPTWMPKSRQGRMVRYVRTPEEAREAVRDNVAKGAEALKFYEYMKPEVVKAAADEAHRLGKPIFAHTLDVYSAANLGYQSVEHFWAIVYTSIQDSAKKDELDIARNTGKIETGQFHVFMEPEPLDRIIKAMVDHNVHWSPTTGARFGYVSPRAAALKQQALALLKDPRFPLSKLTVKTVEGFYDMLDTVTPQRRAELVDGYRRLENFERRFVAAGGKIHAGTDPGSDPSNSVPPAFAMHVEMQLLRDAGLTAPQVIQAGSLNVAQAWRKDKDYGSVEKGKVADLSVVYGDVAKDMAAAQNAEMVFVDGKLVGGTSYAKP